MYLNFYHFVDYPFSVTPDPRFLYLSPSHKEALGAIIYGIENRKGFVSVSGEVGTGKTTIIRACLENLNREDIRFVYVFDPNISFLELLKVIFRELDLEPENARSHDMIQQFHRYLIDEYSQGRNIAIIIDEAQNTPVQTLENLRMLSNLETTEDKLVQIVLVGQPEMEDKLNRYELRQLKQRIAVRATIQCLTPEECKEYMLYRLGSVTPEENQVITHKAMDLIIEKSQGIPRVINVLCDNALISGFGYMKNPVTPQIVKEVIRDYEGRSAPKGWRRWGRVLLYLLIFGLIGAGAAAAIYYFFPGLLGK